VIFQARDMLAAVANGVLEDRCQVCIVGSGCGGATVARRLAERGIEVMILEQGGCWVPNQDFDQRELNMIPRLSGGRGVEESDDRSVTLAYGQNLGGASVQYRANSYRTPIDRLELWASKYGLQGHGLDDLGPLFTRLEAELSIQPAGDELVNPMNARVRDAATRLGWTVGRVPQARTNCSKCGYCSEGCAYDAKQSMLVTALPAAMAAGARIYTDCRAKQITRERGRVKHLLVDIMDRATGRPTGLSFRVDAQVFVIAGGGYGSPTFLLSQGFKDELPELGRHFFCNPSPSVHAIFPEDTEQWRNIPSAWGVEEFRLSRHDSRGEEDSPFFGKKGEYVEGGYLMMANQLHPAAFASVLPGFGDEHARLMSQYRRLGGTIAWIDDAEEGTIEWVEGARKITVPLTGGNERRIRDAYRKQAQLLLSAGAIEVIFGDAKDTRVRVAADVDDAVDALDLRPGRNLLSAPHPGGACRMGTDASNSVVGLDNRVHGFENLYVTDSSVFPTGPSVDPSLTIMAFSHIAAGSIASAL
jgi:choline dehydrogenase-like flavoprotein